MSCGRCATAPLKWSLRAAKCCRKPDSRRVAQICASTFRSNQSSRSRSVTTSPTINRAGVIPAAFAASGRSQGRRQRTLSSGGAVLDEGGRRERRQSVADQLAADARQRADAHVDHDRLSRTRERAPVELGASVLEVTGREHHRLGMIAVGQRDARVGRHATGRSDARHDLEVDARLDELLELLTAAAEDEGIAALESYHPLAFLASETSRRLISSCGKVWLPASLADIDAFCFGTGDLENVGCDQMIVHQRIGATDETHCPYRQQLRIAGPCTHQRNRTATRLRAALVGGGVAAMRGGVVMGSNPSVGREDLVCRHRWWRLRASLRLNVACRVPGRCCLFCGRL